MNIQAIFITLLSGLSFFIGYLITKLIKDEKKLITFSVGFSFTIILGLIFTDLLPECLEFTDNKLIILGFVILGILLLKVLDLFIPDHEHEHTKKKDHMEHIGLISTLALFIHNVIEGTAIYTATLSSISIGLFTSLGVSFHNIPLGIQISSLVKNKKEKLTLLTILSLSSIFGVIILKLFKITLTSYISGILISITLGMLMYIAFFELLCEVKENIKKKELLIGIITGIVLILVSHLFH